jgi:protein-L-isoaspartate(D-aspartate) O-methyltransferase
MKNQDIDTHPCSSRRMLAMGLLLLFIFHPYNLFASDNFSWFGLWRDGIDNPQTEDGYRMARTEMVEEQIRSYGITNAAVIKAMLEVPRHIFVPEEQRSQAYGDHPLPIGYGQTISQPLIVAYMCDMAKISPDDRVLEVGTGSGYHAAVMSRLAKVIYSMEIVPELAERSQKALAGLGYDNIETRYGDGYYGWPEKGPFQVIMVTAAAGQIPPPLLEQLAEGGRMLIPVGQPFLVQNLVIAEKRNGKIYSRTLIPVRFVPLMEDR